MLTALKPEWEESVVYNFSKSGRKILEKRLQYATMFRGRRED